MQIEKVCEPIITVRRSQYPDDNLPEFLLVGRSNVGKSSFINTIIERKNFAKTSSKPGKTQTLNFYLINDAFYLVDVPGYGYASVSKDKKKKFGLMIEEYLKNRSNLKNVFLLIDYRHKPTEDDILMYNFLKYYCAVALSGAGRTAGARKVKPAVPARPTSLIQGASFCALLFLARAPHGLYGCRGLFYV